jgi:hypothetical protein
LKDPKLSEKSLTSINALAKGFQKAFVGKEIDKTEYMRGLSLIKQAQSKNNLYQ